MNKMKNLIPVFIATTLLSTTAVGSYAATPDRVEDRETVYSLLNHDGSVKKTIVVDWIYLEGNGKVSVTDYGPLSQIKNVSGLEKPMVKNDQIVWDVDVKGNHSLYYSGETEKELPVDVAITYTLNGEKVEASSLAGKNGRLKIEVKIKNRLQQKDKISFTGYKGAKQSVEKELVTPMLSLVSINIPTEHFTEIKTGDAMTVMTGKTLSATWMVVPNPEETITLEMEGKEIQLEPITITLIPKLPPVPEVPVKGDLEKLADGVEQISSALEQLGSGTDHLADGNRQVKNGLIQISQGLGQLIKVNQSQADLVKKSLDANQKALETAEDLAAEKPQDPRWQALIQTLQGQQQMLTLLDKGGNLQGQPFPGLAKIGEGLIGSKAGIDQLSAASEKLEKGVRDLGAGIMKLSGGAVEMKKGLISGLGKLYEGEAVLDQTKAAAERYDTFLGKPQGAKGEVRFILKTDPVKPVQTKVSAEQKPMAENRGENRSFFEEILQFFIHLF
ncbi:MAG: hypothetical protein IMW85_02880 [Thermicanus sp.]|nr:hypothetical protein [Thermicanus sp.]